MNAAKGGRKGKGRDKIEIPIDVASHVPSSLVHNIVCGQDGSFLEFIESKTECKVSFEAPSNRKPFLMLSGTSEQLDDAQAMAENLVQEVTPDLKLLEQDCEPQPPAPDDKAEDTPDLPGRAPPRGDLPSRLPFRRSKGRDSPER